MKFCRVSKMSLVVCGLLAFGTVSQAQEAGAPPDNPVIVETRIFDSSVNLRFLSEPKGVSAAVVFDKSQLLSGRRASVSPEECPRIAQSIEDAVAAVQSRKPFQGEKVGELIIEVGVEAFSVNEKGGTSREEEREVIILTNEARGYFTDPLNMRLIPTDAKELAKALRRVPPTYLRLKSAINFDAIHHAQ